MDPSPRKLQLRAKGRLLGGPSLLLPELHPQGPSNSRPHSRDTSPREVLSKGLKGHTLGVVIIPNSPPHSPPHCCVQCGLCVRPLALTRAFLSPSSPFSASFSLPHSLSLPLLPPFSLSFSLHSPSPTPPPCSFPAQACLARQHPHWSRQGQVQASPHPKLAPAAWLPFEIILENIPWCGQPSCLLTVLPLQDGGPQGVYLFSPDSSWHLLASHTQTCP